MNDQTNNDKTSLEDRAREFLETEYSEPDLQSVYGCSTDDFIEDMTAFCQSELRRREGEIADEIAKYITYREKGWSEGDVKLFRDYIKRLRNGDQL